MANSVYIAVSLDGFIATEDGGVEWLDDIPNPDGSDFGYAAFNQKIDALLMGRNTFEKILTFEMWPYEKPVFVLSNSRKNVPEEIEGKAEIVNGDLSNVLDKLKQRGHENLYVDGGQLIQSLLRTDKIDEMILTRVPVLLGKGIPLFGELDKPMLFDHQSTKVHNNFLVTSHYTRRE